MFPVKTLPDWSLYNVYYMASTRRTGTIGENIARQFLERKGFSIIEMNYRKTYGEIDIIAEKEGTVRFVEVKSVTREPSADISRVTDSYRPEELAHESKLHKVARTAQAYMAARGDVRDYQVDVVGVILDPINKQARCRLFEQVLG